MAMGVGEQVGGTTRMNPRFLAWKLGRRCCYKVTHGTEVFGDEDSAFGDRVTTLSRRWTHRLEVKSETWAGDRGWKSSV